MQLAKMKEHSSARLALKSIKHLGTEREREKLKTEKKKT